MKLWLDPDELVEFTGKHTRPAQIRALEAAGIPCLVVGGQVRVARAAVEHRLGVPSSAPAEPGEKEPDFEAIR